MRFTYSLHGARVKPWHNLYFATALMRAILLVTALLLCAIACGAPIDIDEVSLRNSIRANVFQENLPALKTSLWLAMEHSVNISDCIAACYLLCDDSAVELKKDTF